MSAHECLLTTNCVQWLPYLVGGDIGRIGLERWMAESAGKIGQILEVSTSHEELGACSV